MGSFQEKGGRGTGNLPEIEKINNTTERRERLNKWTVDIQLPLLKMANPSMDGGGGEECKVVSNEKSNWKGKEWESRTPVILKLVNRVARKTFLAM